MLNGCLHSELSPHVAKANKAELYRAKMDPYRALNELAVSPRKNENDTRVDGEFTFVYVFHE